MASMRYSYRLRVAEHPTAMGYAVRWLPAAQHLTLIGIEAGDAWIIASSDDGGLAAQVHEWLDDEARARGEA